MQESSSELTNDRLDRLERRFDVLTAELAAATAGRDRAHDDISKLLEYFEFCLAEIGRLEGRLDSDVRSTLDRFEDELRVLKDRAATNSSELHTIRSDHQAFADIANGHAIHTSELLAELHNYEVDTRTASDDAVLEVAEVATDLRRAIAEVAGRDVVGRDDYAVLVELAEALEIAVGQTRVLADEAMSHSEAVEVSVAEVAGRDVVERVELESLSDRAGELDDRLVEVDATLGERFDTVNAKLGELDDEARKTAKAVYAERVSRVEAIDDVAAERERERARVDELIAGRVSATDASLDELRAAVAEVAGRDVVGRDDYAVLVELAEELEISVSEARVLADEAMSRSEAVEASVAEVAGRDVVERAELESLSDRAGELDDRLDVVAAERERERARVDELIAGRVSATDASLDELRAAVAEVAGRDVVGREDYAVLSEWTEELEIAVTQARVLANEAISRSEEVAEGRDALRNDLDDLVTERVDGLGAEVSALDERIEASDQALAELRGTIDEVGAREVVDMSDYQALTDATAEMDGRLNAVDARLASLDEDTKSSSKVIDALISERFETLVRGQSEDREALESLIAQRVDALDTAHGSLRAELDGLATQQSDRLGVEVEALDARLSESDRALRDLRASIGDVADREVVDVEDYEGLVAVAAELDARLSEVDTALSERITELSGKRDSDRVHFEAVVADHVSTLVAQREELRRELDDLVLEKVEALVVDRDKIRRDLERLVSEQAGEFGSGVTDLGGRLEASDAVLAELRVAIAEISQRDVVDRHEYDSVATLAEELELAVAEARVLAEQAIDQSKQTTTTASARHDELVERIELSETSMRTEQQEVVEHLESVEADLREQAKELLSATEETLELSIKAADKAEFAADSADGVRADHEDFVEGHLEVIDAQSERIALIEAQDELERTRSREVDIEFRDEIGELFERLAGVERAVADSAKDDDVIDLPEAEEPTGWQFERRGRWGDIPADKS